MTLTPPSVADFKAHFTRDFPYGSTDATVQDSDITKALTEAAVNINTALFGTEAMYQLCFLYLAAHYLVMDLRASSQGIAGAFSWLTASKSVGSVSEAFAIPQQILDHPEYSYYAKSNYGAKYLSLVLPRMTGQVFIAHGRTQP